MECVRDVGRNKFEDVPEDPTKATLMAIDKNPKAVQSALNRMGSLG